MTPAGFPHSDIQGSTDACSSPWLFAACHVLPRLPAPRHPPCALTALDQFPSELHHAPAVTPEPLKDRSTVLTSSPLSARLSTSSSPTRIVNQQTPPASRRASKANRAHRNVKCRSGRAQRPQWQRHPQPRGPPAFTDLPRYRRHQHHMSFLETTVYGR